MDAIRPAPLFLFKEMIIGSLRPHTLDNPSGVLHTLVNLHPNEPALQPDAPLSDYINQMKSVYQQLAKQSPQNKAFISNVHEPGIGDKAALLRANSPHNQEILPEATPSLQLPVRYTKYQAPEISEHRIVIFPTIIRREGDRLLSIILDIMDRQPDPDLLLFELRSILDSLSELLTLLPDSSTQQHPVHRILKHELEALHEEIRLRAKDHDSIVDSYYISTLRKPSEHITHTPALWQSRIKQILDQWTAKYYKTAPVIPFCELIDQIEKESAVNSDLSKTSRHAQIILLLMVVRRISSDAVKKGVTTYKNAVHQLRLVDERIRYGGETAKESAEIFQFDELLEEADANYDITRFPVISKRYDQIRDVIRQAFQHKDTLPAQMPPPQTQNSELPSAIDRLRHQYFTIGQLAKYHDREERTIRRNLKKYNIKTIKRAGKVNIPYDEYVKHTE